MTRSIACPAVVLAALAAALAAACTATDAPCELERRAEAAVVAAGARAPIDGAFVVSTRNDNAAFLVSARCDALAAGLPAEIVLPDGSRRACTSAGGSGGKVWFSYVAPADEARTVAAQLGVEPRPRRHPGHRLEARFEVPATTADADELVLVLDVHNAGDVPVAFYVGGRPDPVTGRNGFLDLRAWKDGEPLEERDAGFSLGGLIGEVRLAAGEHHREEVDLRAWFPLREPGIYRVEATYTTAVRPAPAGGARPADEPQVAELLRWDEVLTSSFVVRVDG